MKEVRRTILRFVTIMMAAKTFALATSRVGATIRTTTTAFASYRKRNNLVPCFLSRNPQRKSVGGTAAFVHSLISHHTDKKSSGSSFASTQVAPHWYPGCSARHQGALFSSSASDETTAALQKTLAKEPPSDDELNLFDDGCYHHVYEAEQTIKKSRFLGLARYADSWEDASNFVHHVRTKVHPKARHWCFAYRGSIVGGSSESSDDGDININSATTSTTITERASDDGEPTGTAGVPILNSLSTETDASGGLIDVVVVVVRYSGGIKLGAGGLIRAYGGTARLVLNDSTFHHHVPVIPKEFLSLTQIQPKYVGAVYELAAKFGCASVEATSDDYTSFGVTCDAAVATKFREGLLDATRGSAVIR